MLRQLTIKNIGVIDRLDIPFEAGFTVLTGETGAGKSIIVDCISLALGAKADALLLRSGAETARVEAVFELDADDILLPPELLRKIAVKDSEPGLSLRMTREISKDGRTECTVNGRKVALKVLQETGRRLAEAHGQRQTLSLLRPGEQRDILDRYGDLEETRERVAETVRQLRRIRAELGKLRRKDAEVAARRDALEHELRAFREIAPVPGEDDALQRERSRLAHAEQLGLLAGASRGLLIDPPRGDTGAVDALAETAQNMRDAAELDADLRPTWEAAEALAEQAQDMALSLSRYAETLETDPNRLDTVEERIAALDDLKRKHGETLENVITWGEEAEQELAGLEKASEQVEELVVRESRLNGEVMERARSLSGARRAAGARLSRALEIEIETLALAGTRVVVQVCSKLEGVPPSSVMEETQDFADALTLCDESGCDEVEILIAPNEGEPPRPLSRIASGGEMARVTLAIKTVLAHADVRSLVLDEIDVGVGGHVGGTIGSKLADLARRQQVVCVTHLPQVAAHADHHMRVFKRTERGRTLARVEKLDNHDSRIQELSKMIGSNSPAGRQSMGELLDAAHGYDAERESGVTLRLLEAAG